MRKTKPFEYHVECETGCFICTSHSRQKFGYIKVRRYYKDLNAHRMIYEECYGEIPDGLVVRHKCDNPSCINPEHLELGTVQDNNQDKIDRNRIKRALTDEMVREIISDHSSTNKALAHRYGVHPQIISEIRRGRLYKHVDGERVAGGYVKGSRHGFSKLVEGDVIDILTDRTMTARKMADKYGVSKQLIDQIRQRIIWKHVVVTGVGS